MRPTTTSTSRSKIPGRGFLGRSVRASSSRSSLPSRFTRAAAWGSSSLKRWWSAQAARLSSPARAGLAPHFAFAFLSHRRRRSLMERNRILVVDDDPLIRGSLYEMLRGQRYDVEMASDGAEAMDHLERRLFQLVIADWKMPQVDGMALLEHIRTHYPDVCVVLIT